MTNNPLELYFKCKAEQGPLKLGSGSNNRLVPPLTQPWKKSDAEAFIVETFARGQQLHFFDTVSSATLKS